MKSPQLGINPLPWILDTTFHLDEPSLRAGFAAVSSIGFTNVQADIPEGFTVDQYLSLLDEFGLKPAPSYFGANFDQEDLQVDIRHRAEVIAKQQKELGASMIFIASDLIPERFERPALGFANNAETLQLATNNLAEVCEVFQVHGLKTALHPHVGTRFEVEDEVEYVLENISPDLLSFGPDTGHLFWAGIDPVAMIQRHAERVIGMHIKDADSSAIALSKSTGSDYFGSTIGNHIWKEPGRGNVDLSSAIDLVIDSKNLEWFVLEVDVPDIGTAAESTAFSYNWITTSRLASFV